MIATPVASSASDACAELPPSRVRRRARRSSATGSHAKRPSSRGAEIPDSVGGARARPRALSVDDEICVYNGPPADLPDPTWSDIYWSVIFTQLCAFVTGRLNANNNADDPNPRQPAHDRRHSRRRELRTRWRSPGPVTGADTAGHHELGEWSPGLPWSMRWRRTPVCARVRAPS